MGRKKFWRTLNIEQLKFTLKPETPTFPFLKPGRFLYAMYDGNIMKKRSALTLLPATSTVIVEVFK